MTLMTVPIVDMSPFHSGSAAERGQLAALVDRACRDIGFLVITGHGVAPGLLARVDSQRPRLFQLPLDQKEALKRPRDDQVRGYSAVGNEGLSYSLGRRARGI